MKILLAIDGSTCSDRAVMEVARRPWPARTQLRIISAITVPVAIALAPPVYFAGFRADMISTQRELSHRILDRAVEVLQASVEGSRLLITTEVIEGAPRRVIIEEAERWGADMIVVGSHGYGRFERLLLGSVSHAVIAHAPCSVEVIRCHDETTSRVSSYTPS